MFNFFNKQGKLESPFILIKTWCYFCLSSQCIYIDWTFIKFVLSNEGTKQHHFEIGCIIFEEKTKKAYIIESSCFWAVPKHVCYELGNSPEFGVITFKREFILMWTHFNVWNECKQIGSVHVRGNDKRVGIQLFGCQCANRYTESHQGVVSSYRHAPNYVRDPSELWQ